MRVYRMQRDLHGQLHAANRPEASTTRPTAEVGGHAATVATYLRATVAARFV